jgi:predicted amidohydrolase YtcJ
MPQRVFLIITLLVTLPAMSFTPTAQSPPKTLAADLIVKNARIYTMDPGHPRAEAVAVLGNRIVAVGTTVEIERLAGPGSRIVDAQGMTVVPGFNDAHVHFMVGGFQLSNVDLRSANSPQEFARRIAQFASKNNKGRWITGGNWDHESWPGAPLPTKELIDAATPDTPVFVSRLDGHMALANTLALKLAGITRNSEDPPGGLIVRDRKTGEPTGVLKDAAMNFVNKVVPEPSFDEKLAAARAATDYAASLGVTSVQDVLAGDDVGVYQELLERGQLKTRIYAISPLPAWERLANSGVRSHFGSAMLRIGGLKGFADGSLGSTTALFFDPYVDAPETRGLASDEMYPEGAMSKRVSAADRAGLQVMIHAIGDRANDEILKIYEQVERENGDRDRRFRIEHAQHLRAIDIPRFARDRVIASMQPYHAIDDGRWAEKRIGHDRALTTYAFRSLLDAKAVLAFGTDWTVAPLNPMLSVYAAVTRRTLDGRNPDGWIREQKINVDEAVRAYTVGSAYAEFTENEKGRVSPGMLADLVILSGDIFTMDPALIEKTKVLSTILDGKVVFELKK